MINGIKVEICCGGISDIKTALQFPIDRIELNSALELGGLTPSISTLKMAKQLTSLPICCMARCRTSGFCYDDNEYATILADAKLLLENGADGIVFGFLNQDKTINKERTKEMVSLIKSYNREAVFHKAFDDTSMLETVKDLIELGVDRILTSGGKNYPDITKGISVLKELEEKYGDKIQILPGGGIRANNVKQVLTEANLKQVHMTASIQKVDGDSNPYTSVNFDKLNDILSNI